LRLGRHRADSGRPLDRISKLVGVWLEAGEPTRPPPETARLQTDDATHPVALSRCRAAMVVAQTSSVAGLYCRLWWLASTSRSDHIRMPTQHRQRQSPLRPQRKGPVQPSWSWNTSVRKRYRTIRPG